MVLPRRPAFFLGFAKRRIMRRSLPSRMQGFEECDERRCFRWTQVFPERWHVAASLDHLANELVLREPDGNAVQSRASLAATLPEGVAVATLLGLKDERALPLKRGAMQEFLRHGITAPGVHVRTPGRVSREMRERSQRYRDQQDRQDCDR